MCGIISLEMFWKLRLYPEHVEGIAYPICPGNSHGWKSLLLGKRTLDCFAHPVCTVTLTDISGPKGDEQQDESPPSTLLPQ